MNSAISRLKSLNVRKSFSHKVRKSTLPALEQVEDRMLMTGMPCIGPVCAPIFSCSPTPAPSCSTPTPAPTYTGVLAGTVFNDANKDSTLNGCDTYLQGANVQLYKAGSSCVIATQTTGANGQYAFTGLAPGSYTIVQTAPCGYTSESTSIKSGLNPATSGGANVINATVVDPTKVYADNGGNITTQYTVVGVVINGVSELTSAGTLTTSLGSAAGATNLGGASPTYCVDVNTEMSFQGGESYQVKPQLVTDLTGNGTCKISADHAGRIAYLFNHYANANLSSTQGAALQLAIWELLYDNGSTADFTHGNFAIDANANSYTDQNTLNTVISQATSFFNESAGKSETAIFLNAPAYNSGGNGYQSVLTSCALDFADVTKPTTTGGGSCSTGSGFGGTSWFSNIFNCLPSVSTVTNKPGGLSFGCFSFSSFCW